MTRSFCFLTLIAIAGSVVADVLPYGVPVDGDLTVLSVYEVPVVRVDDFRAASGIAARTTIENQGRFWLTYEQAGGNSQFRSWFTIQIPRGIDELTDLTSPTATLVETMGEFRTHVEFSRQVPEWCTTTALDANKLEYAYVEYIWVKSGQMKDATDLLAKRGALLRGIYGTTSDGNSALEGFASMVAPFQLMFVLFSSDDSRSGALDTLYADLEQADLLDKWRQLDSRLKQAVSKREFRAGRYVPALSAPP